MINVSPANSWEDDFIYTVISHIHGFFLIIYEQGGEFSSICDWYLLY